VVGVVMVVSLVLPMHARKRPRKGEVVPIDRSRAA